MRLLGCFSIQKFKITKINFKELIRNKNGSGASCLVRCGLYNVGVTLHGCFSILRLEAIKLNFENSYETRMGLVLLV